jgi:hypothetical protein
MALELLGHSRIYHDRNMADRTDGMTDTSDYKSDVSLTGNDSTESLDDAIQTVQTMRVQCCGFEKVDK